MSEENKADVLADALRERIKRGDFGTGGRIPPVTQLSKEWGISRVTAYQALQLLQSEGVLVAKAKSYYANYPIMRIPGITPTFDSYLADLGLTPKMENLIDPEIVTMPPEVAKMFGQSEGVHVVHRLRRQGTVEVPYRLAEIWYPANLAAEFVDRMRQDSSLDVLKEIKRVHGVYITQVHEEVLTRIPTLEESRQLSIVRTAPVLEVHRSNFAQDGTPIMFNRIILVGAYFSLTYDYDPGHWKDKSA